MSAKVWEETWRTMREPERGLDGDLKLWMVVDAAGDLVADTTADESAAKLMASAPDMARVLLAIEWQWRERSDRNRCPSCDGDEPDGDCPRYGHRDNCALDAALRKAGVR